MKDSFNSDFYVTAATIIPVLYLALTLQGSTLEQLFKIWKENLVPFSVDRMSLKERLREIVFTSVAICGAGGMFIGIVGEFIAVQAIYNKTAGPAAGKYVFFSISFLLALVLAGPFAKFLITYFKLARYPGGKEMNKSGNSPDNNPQSEDWQPE